MKNDPALASLLIQEGTEELKENKIDYILVGGYYIHDLMFSEESRSNGCFGQIHYG